MLIRAASRSDASFLLELRNDADAVRFSRSGRPVLAEEHAEWIDTVFAPGSSRRVWILELGGRRVGQGRVDLSPDGRGGEVAIGVRRDARGRGLGRTLLDHLCRELASTELHAWVHRDNAASLRIFLASGFHETGCQEAFIELTRPGAAMLCRGTSG